MTNLTEQWKKGELPCGWYYIKIADIVFIDFFEGKVWKNKKDEYIDEVLSEVPSYELWKAVHEQWKVLLEENKRLKHDVGNLGYKIKNQRKEIDNRLKENTKLKETISNDIFLIKSRDSEIVKLKELLKECSYRIDWRIRTSDDETQKLFDEISKVLGEE